MYVNFFVSNYISLSSIKFYKIYTYQELCTYHILLAGHVKISQDFQAVIYSLPAKYNVLQTVYAPKAVASGQGEAILMIH